MSINPNKSFGMKATNKSYTLEFRRNESTTEVTATDLETKKMDFGQRVATAWSILTGTKSIGEYVFPMRLRNTDFYHLSFIYRPEKVDKPMAIKAASAEKNSNTNKVAIKNKVKKTQSNRKPKTVAPKI